MLLFLLLCAVILQMKLLLEVVNPLDPKGQYGATLNNTKLVHWLLIGELLHLLQQGGIQPPPRCTKCNSPPVNGQCTNHHIAL